MCAFFLPVALGTLPSELVRPDPLNLVGFVPESCLLCCTIRPWELLPMEKESPKRTFLLAAQLLEQRLGPPCFEPPEQLLCRWFLPFGGENLCLGSKSEQLLGVGSGWDLPLVKFPSAVGWRGCWSSAQTRLDLWMEQSLK